MNKASDKGNALEAAVHAIERAILSHSPNLKEDTFTITAKKIINVGGVRHEIDLYVEVDIGGGYKSKFIFECKNQRKPTSKNDIIVFSEKIDAVSAQQGFFVALTFSRDAQAQASKDDRIALLTATEMDIAEMSIPFSFHHIIRDKGNSSSEVMLAIDMPGTPGTKVPINIASCAAKLQGSEFSFHS